MTSPSKATRNSAGTDCVASLEAVSPLDSDSRSLVSAIIASAILPHHKAKAIYALLCRPTDPRTPEDLATNAKWDGIVQSICEAGSRGDIELVLSVVQAAAAFRQALSSSPLRRKRSSPVSDEQRPKKRPQIVTTYKALELVKKSPAYTEVTSRRLWNLFKLSFAEKKSFALWTPSKTWASADPVTLSHIQRLEIPRVPKSSISLPDLLLYKLGTSDALYGNLFRKLQSVRNVDPIILQNTSGSGKTRFQFELAMSGWSLFFTCAVDRTSNPYGSTDVLAAVRILEGGIPGSEITFVPLVIADLQGNSSAQDKQYSTDRRNNNRVLAERIFRVMLLSRMIVLGYFRDSLILWNKFHSDAEILDKDAIKMWAHLQIQPSLFYKTDIFEDVMNALLTVDPIEIDREIVKTVSEWEAEGFFVRYIIFDELQVFASQWEYAFSPCKDEPVNASTGFCRPEARPLLSPFLSSILTRSISQPVVSGTKLRMPVLNASLSGSAKLWSEPKLFTEFGYRFGKNAISQVLNHFFGARFVSNIDNTLLDNIVFWLSGRHRFIMLFVQFVLLLGPQSLSRVLDNILHKLIGSTALPDDEDIPEMTLKPLVDPSDERFQLALEINPAFMDTIMGVVSTWLFNGTLPTLGTTDLDYVTFGFGMIIADAGNAGPRKMRTENIAAASLTTWLKSEQQAFSLKYRLNTLLATPQSPSRGLSFEDVLVYMLAEELSKGAVLNEVFDLCYLKPPWESEVARLISVFKADRPGADSPELVDINLTNRYAWSTTKIHETLAWFDLGKAACYRVPMLKPDNFMGPDIVLGALLSSGHELYITVQGKYRSTTQTESDVESAFFKLSPEGFYSGAQFQNSTHRSDIHKKMQHLIGETWSLDMSGGKQFTVDSEYSYSDSAPILPVLRVFAGFEETVTSWPDMKDGKLGRYPLARLSKKFMDKIGETFPSYAEHREHLKQRSG